MIEPASSRFWQLALQSGLIDADRLATCWATIPADKRTADAVDRRLARKTIEDGHLTLWQAQQILAGRSQGFRFDRYVLLQLIGEGGMGRVYLALDGRLHRKVALKILSRERMNNPRALSRFRREAKVGAQLQHENLVRIYDEGQANGHHYLVMEFIEGKSVGKIIQERGPLPPTVVARLGMQIALGLEHATGKGLIHRDVNPMNIMLARDGAAKLTDLGLAIDLSDQDDLVTRDGATVGTFDYISPEQARHSRSVDTRADLYSLGCSLYHMLAGRVPFPMPSLPEKLYAHQALEPDALPTAVPEGMAAVVRKLMAKAPGDRYQRPAEAARDLEPFVGAAWTLAEVEAAPPLPALARPDEEGTAPTRPEVMRPGSDAELGPGPDTPAGSSTTPLVDGLSLFPQLDLGPALNLSGSRTEDRKPQPARVPAEGSRRKLILVGLAVMVVAAAGATFAALGGRRPKTPATPTKPAVVETPETPSKGPLADITVRWADGSEEPAASLVDACRRAAGKGAEVLLRNARPLRFDVALPISVPEGSLVVRAAEGARPVLLLSFKGANPWLRTRTRGSLTMVGLSFAADAPAGDGTRGPSLFETRGDATFRRCAFATTAHHLVAVTAEGGSLSAEDCAFEGFDNPVSAAGFPNTTLQVNNCLFERGPVVPSALGWALRVKREAGVGDGPRRVKVERCTSVGLGLLDLEGFSAAGPLSAEVRGTVVADQGLLMWRPEPSAFPAALKWTGGSNRYALSGPGWVTLPPRGLDVLAGGPTDLEGWQKAMPGDAGGRDGPVKLAGGGRAQAGAIDPADYAALGEEKPVGIDPSKVGPPPQPPDKR